MNPEYSPLSSLKTRRPSRVNRFLAYVESLSPGDSLFFRIALIACTISLAWFIVTLAQGSRVEVPGIGGTYTEGIVGTPRFVNPVLAVTRADKDLSALLFDGLMTLGNDGVLVPNVAEKVNVSTDGLTYNIVLRKDVTFHDGTPLTALDVVYTVGRIEDPSLMSPLRPQFEGVTVEQVDEYELNFVLDEPYTPFIENLTFGILPHHIWKEVTNEEFPFSQRNSEPVGSGPYKIDSITRNASGIPEVYRLAPHAGYHRGTPKIEHFGLMFFGNDDALIAAFKEHTIDGVAGIDQSKLYELGLNTDTHHIIRIPLPRTFALFFNQNKSAVLRDPAVRTALSTAIDRTALVNTVQGGYALPLYTPLPIGFGGTTTTTPQEASTDPRAILEGAGWKQDATSSAWEKKIDGTATPLSISISTVNNPTFEATAEFLRNAWEALGIHVDIKQFEQSDLTQGVIRPRDYEALLFGTHIGRSLDYYPFWHSSQRNDPGLNVSLYANITTDAILENIRTKHTDIDRNAELKLFSEEIVKEAPALFLYQPELIYIFPNAIDLHAFTGMSDPSERFASVHTWYLVRESVWSFLTTYVDSGTTPAQ